MLRARPRDSRVGGFRPVVALRRVPKRNSSVLNRSVALSAAEVHKLFRLHRYSRVLKLLCWLNPQEIAFKVMLLRVRFLRQEILRPMVLYRTVLQPRNRTIVSLEWSDDYVREFFMFNDREQLATALASLRAPASLKLPGYNTGIVDTEFAFLLYLFRMVTASKLTLMATIFGEDYSVISRSLSAFGSWLHHAHSHRLTDSLHFWSQHVALFNAKIVAKGVPPAYNRVWAFVDATLVCTARPSDVSIVTYPAPGPANVWDIDAQYAFYCSYAMQHGLKWQAVVGPCGLIMDLTGAPQHARMPALSRTR
jgi:hypothetical protein